MSIIGQPYIKEKIDNLSLNSLPHTLFFLGKRGCGKHFISQLIAKHLGLIYKDITSKVSGDMVFDIYTEVSPTLYVINLEECDLRKQNILLKIAEEPLTHSYLIFTSNNTDNVIPTLLNRCIVWEFQEYSEEELKEFATINKIEFNAYAKTPGQLIQLNGIDISEIKKFAEKIVDKIGNASIPNTLSIDNKITFKNEKEKIDAFLLCNFIKEILHDRYIATPTTAFLEAYYLFKNLCCDQLKGNLDQRYLWDRSLIQLKYILKEIKE